MLSDGGVISGFRMKQTAAHLAAEGAMGTIEAQSFQITLVLRRLAFLRVWMAVSGSSVRT